MEQNQRNINPMTYRLNDAEFLRTPAPILAKMRAAGPLARVKVPLIGICYVTTTDAAARALLKDEAHFARNPANAGGRDISRYYWFLPPFMRPLTRNILSLDGDEHTRLRRAVEPSFSRVTIDALRPEITEIADDLLNQLDTSKPVDIVTEYARQLPLDVISALLGIQPDLRKRIARAIAPISGPTGKLTLFRALPGLYKSIKLLRAEIAAIKSAPRAGLLSDLIHDPASDLTDDEVLSMAFVLFVAGHETTLHLISTAIYGLSEHRQHRAIFQSGDKLASARAIEEFLRFFSPVLMTKPLFARTSHAFLGQQLQQGDKVIALLIAANHDPARFENAEQLDPARRPNAHIGFGFGPHVCLGMQLARAEAQIALERLFHRFPNLERAPKDAPANYSERFGMRGLKRLDLHLTP